MAGRVSSVQLGNIPHPSALIAAIIRALETQMTLSRYWTWSWVWNWKCQPPSEIRSGEPNYGNDGSRHIQDIVGYLPPKQSAYRACSWKNGNIHGGKDIKGRSHILCVRTTTSFQGGAWLCTRPVFPTCEAVYHFGRLEWTPVAPLIWWTGSKDSRHIIPKVWQRSWFRMDGLPCQCVVGMVNICTSVSTEKRNTRWMIFNTPIFCIL